MFDSELAKSAMKSQALSWLQREIFLSPEPPGVEECMDVLAQLGFSQADLEHSHWAIVISSIDRFVREYGLQAEYMGDAKSVGVQGDDRSYTRVVMLWGKFPGWDMLEQLSSAISNKFPINRVSYEFIPRHRILPPHYLPQNR